LYNSITAAQRSNNTNQVYFQIGRLLYLILIFDPIEEASLRLRSEMSYSSMLMNDVLDLSTNSKHIV